MRCVLATSLTKRYGGRIGVIDSQKGQSLEHVGVPLPGNYLVEEGTPIAFDIITLKDGNPNDYIGAINEFEATKEHSVIVIDSLSQAWTGEGGLLEIKDRSGGGGPQQWAQATPIQNRFINKLIGCQRHLIATVRVKTETVWERNAEGKTEGHKVGGKAVQREGIEYEFGIYGSMDITHTMRVINCRSCTALDRAIIHQPNEQLVRPLIEWLDTGKTDWRAEPHQRMATREMINELENLFCSKANANRTQFEEHFFAQNRCEVIQASYEVVEACLVKARASGSLPAKQKKT